MGSLGVAYDGRQGHPVRISADYPGLKHRVTSNPSELPVFLFGPLRNLIRK
jgi:hypothetical protein